MRTRSREENNRQSTSYIPILFFPVGFPLFDSKDHPSNSPSNPFFQILVSGRWKRASRIDVLQLWFKPRFRRPLQLRTKIVLTLEAMPSVKTDLKLLNTKELGWIRRARSVFTSLENWTSRRSKIENGKSEKIGINNHEPVCWNRELKCALLVCPPTLISFCDSIRQLVQNYCFPLVVHLFCTRMLSFELTELTKGRKIQQRKTRSKHNIPYISIEVQSLYVVFLYGGFFVREFTLSTRFLHVNSDLECFFDRGC